MSDKPQASPQPLTPVQIARLPRDRTWKMRDSAWDGSWAVEGPRGFDERRPPFYILLDDPDDAALIAAAPRLLATIDALNAELHLLREGRRPALALCTHDGTPMEMLCRNCGEKSSNEAWEFGYQELKRLDSGKRRLLEPGPALAMVAVTVLENSPASFPNDPSRGKLEGMKSAIKAAAQAAFERAE